ncbi:hypothetical protein [Acetilactobacillus jinshanensis]|nr:hypothetical protein [Acetilactobacillus jinshanensis]
MLKNNALLNGTSSLARASASAFGNASIKERLLIGGKQMLAGGAV